MAWIEQRKTSGGQRWRVVWREVGSRRVETFDEPDSAEQFRNLIQGYGGWPPGYVPGKGFSQPERRLTLKAWCLTAIDARTGVEARTRKDYRSMINRHLGNLGRKPVAGVTRIDLGEWVNSLSLSPKSIANLHGLVSSCLQDAVQDDVIAKNPAKSMTLPRKDLGESEIITIPQSWEIDAVVQNMEEPWAAFVRTLQETGMRFSESTALTPRGVDLFVPEIKVFQTWKRAAHGGVFLGPTKTAKGRRRLSILDATRDRLAPLVAGKEMDEPVFAKPNGKPLLHSHFYNLVWRPAMFQAMRCDVHRKPKWQKGHEVHETCGCAGVLSRPFRIHDLRHYHASVLIDAGVEPMRIQRRLGHNSIKTTMDTYGHLMPDSDEEILAALG